MPVIEIDGFRYRTDDVLDADLANVVKDIRGVTFVGIDTDTEPEMLKTGNPYVGRVRKLCSMTVQLNASDEKKMLGADPSYTKGASYHEAVVRPDGTATPLSVQKKNGTLYLRAHPLSVQSVRFVLDSGEEISRETLAPWLKTPAEPTTQRAITRAAADAPFRLFKMASVKAMRLYHEEVTF
jgi:hypothetical protein